MCTFHRCEANLEREVSHVTQLVTVRWDLNLELYSFCGSRRLLLGRALGQAHVFRQGFPMCVYPPPRMLPFPLGDFKLRVRANAADSELCWGCNISCTGEWSQGCVHGPGVTARQRGGHCGAV